VLIERGHEKRGRAVGRRPHFYLWRFGEFFILHS